MELWPSLLLEQNNQLQIIHYYNYQIIKLTMKYSQIKLMIFENKLIISDESKNTPHEQKVPDPFVLVFFYVRICGMTPVTTFCITDSGEYSNNPNILYTI